MNFAEELKLERDIEKIIKSYITEVPYEGKYVDELSMRNDIVEYIKNLIPEKDEEPEQ